MNYKGTYLDQNLSSSFPSSSNGNFQNMYNNPNFPFQGSNMNFSNLNSNINNLNSNLNTMNNNMNSFTNMNGMNTMSMNYNNQNNGFMNHFANQNQNLPMNQGYGTLSSSIPPTFSSRTNTNNYNPSDYINDNFLNKTNNYKPYVNDFSNTTMKVNQNTNATSNNANVTIKRNRKDFLDAKATIQSKIKKNSLLVESDIENEENIFLVNNSHKNVSNTMYSNENIDYTKKEKPSNNINESNNDNLQKLINQIKNIIHS